MFGKMSELGVSLWFIGLLDYIGHPQPPQLNWARVSTGTHPCGIPPRQDGGGTRAPALRTLDDVLRFRGDMDYRAVLLHTSSASSCPRSGRS